ncbi:interferon gamma receptor 1 isoform X1 [Bufo bufo]|uniref:interferon gamma receptor 1 isoform X1 n=1 Tax=Bufo bufo TaxID=8384 RepID=UPI001ABE9B0A|nr:interferon gamma receptor 1 isoform X1 [Bufo bufo]
MEAILHSTLPLLSALTALAAVAGPTLESATTQVQIPFNLMKKSYNFNSTLYWEYNVSSVTPYFQVEYRYYKNKKWTVVETCVNISRHYCDLSEKITDPYIHYGVRVNAFVGSEVSGYAKAEFYLINDGIIGPPTINASEDGKYIYIDVDYPNAPHVDKEKRNVADYLDDLTYELHSGNEIEGTDECDVDGCSFKVLITNQTNYCFRVQGRSDSVPMTIEKSKETCVNFTVQNGISPKKLYTIIVPISIVVFIILVVSCFLIKRKIQAKTMLPLSLNSVTKAMTTRDYLPSDRLTKYDQVSISPVDSPEEKMTPEETNKDLNMSDDSDTRESIDNGYHSSVGETERKSDEDQSGKEEASSSKNYYRTENSDSLLVCVKEEDVPEQEPLRDLKPVTNSYGYDKPHCPL